MLYDVVPNDVALFTDAPAVPTAYEDRLMPHPLLIVTTEKATASGYATAADVVYTNSNAVNQQEALPNHDAPVATRTEAVTGGFQHLVSCVTTDLVAATTNSEDRTGYDENISNLPIDIPDTMLGPIPSNDENLSEGQKKI
ncbi:unnamed protein product [Cuscuta epithymum]|uniref:Uncharacterized protein n=1 Tax=Cuscuta epithymum TaxID=186058 RepID=A0AAV0CX71_9ASTE|nr:unnamed protein product [Cuscuta epithymum]